MIDQYRGDFSICTDDSSLSDSSDRTYGNLLGNSIAKNAKNKLMRLLPHQGLKKLQIDHLRLYSDHSMPSLLSLWETDEMVARCP
jgi:hypothetical protein